jgi:photosystem II stability/assembly factor-like uncharacterized protein
MTAAVAVSPNFETDRNVFAGVPGGILRSTDGGQNWHIASLSSPPPFVLSLVVSPNFAHDGTILAGTLEDGVFYSGDRGEHWSAWNFGLLDLNVICMVISPNFANDETLYVGTDSGIYRSTNGGRAWREVDFSPTLAPVLSLAVSSQYATDGTLFAGTESCGLFRTSDYGDTWTRVGPEIITEAVNSVILSPKFPKQADVLVMLSDVLLLSGDGGQSWSERKTEQIFEGSLTAVAAPQELEPGAPLLVGLGDGRVLRV